MSKQEKDDMETLLDFEPLQPETIVLEATHIHKALQCSQIQNNEERQWQTYLKTLALFGFSQWLLERVPELPINHETCSLQPQAANKIEAVSYLRAGEFTLCIMSMSSLTVKELSIPRYAIDTPELIANFYVVVEVQEELEQVTIQGFMRYEQLIHHLQSIQLSAQADETYQLPLQWFEKNVDLLLLYLRCLEPVASSPVMDIKQFLTQPVLNVGLWLRDEIDDMARGLSWILLPAFSPDAAMRLLRSPTQELEAIRIELQRQGTPIPLEARGGYKDLQLDQRRVRLYAMTWPLLSSTNVPEWKLLLILGAPPGYNTPPYGARMQVSDETSVLVERVLNGDNAYIYACVAGTWDETFLVTISLFHGARLTLPPFAFRPDQIL